MNKFSAGWYVIYTKPRHEKKVVKRLTEKDITAYLPTAKNLRVWHDRKKIIDEPLFPSYVFVYLKDLQSYFANFEIEGVLFFVRFGKEIARISDDIINSIMLLVSHGKEVETCDSQLQPGQKLVIHDGPLTGLSCELIRYNAKQKILVRVHMLNRNILADIPVHFLTTA